MKLDPTTVALIGTAIFEIGARVIPTVKDYTVIGKIIRAITWIHKFLNLKK